MTIQMWSDMSVLEGGLELAGFGKDVRIATEVAPLDSTNLASNGCVTLIGGLKSCTVDMVLMQDKADNSVDETLWTNFGTADVARSIVTNSADGSRCYLMRGINLGYTDGGTVGEIAMTRIAGGSSTGGVVRGRLIHPGSASRTSSATGTGRQLGAVVAGKSLYAALHVLSVAGTSTPTLTVKVQSDDNPSFTSATDRITFTGATVANTYQWSSVAGAITDDYWRVSYTISGTNPSFSFAVTAGIL